MGFDYEICKIRFHKGVRKLSSNMSGTTARTVRLSQNQSISFAASGIPAVPSVVPPFYPHPTFPATTNIDSFERETKNDRVKNTDTRKDNDNDMHSELDPSVMHGRSRISAKSEGDNRITRRQTLLWSNAQTGESANSTQEEAITLEPRDPGVRNSHSSLDIFTPEAHQSHVVKTLPV